MKAFITAVTCGVFCESLLAGGAILGGISPCGGGSPLSIVILALHEPGFWLTSHFHIHDGTEDWLIMALYAAVWSALWYLFWRSRFTRDEKVHNDGA